MKDKIGNIIMEGDTVVFIKQPTKDFEAHFAVCTIITIFEDSDFLLCKEDDAATCSLLYGHQVIKIK